jgi:hypothetical protein
MWRMVMHRDEVADIWEDDADEGVAIKEVVDEGRARIDDVVLMRGQYFNEGIAKVLRVVTEIPTGSLGQTKRPVH